jgi:hypothetical protein
VGLLPEALVDAGLVVEEKQGSYRVIEERLVALLALTATHGIMKMRLLLPLNTTTTPIG